MKSERVSWSTRVSASFQSISARNAASKPNGSPAFKSAMPLPQSNNASAQSKPQESTSVAIKAAARQLLLVMNFFVGAYKQRSKLSFPHGGEQFWRETAHFPRLSLSAARYRGREGDCSETVRLKRVYANETSL